MDLLHLTWLSIHSVTRLPSLVTFTRVTAKNGEPVLSFFNSDETEEVHVDTLKKYSMLADTVEEYVQFGRKFGRPVNNTLFPGVKFYDYDLFEVVRKRLNGENLVGFESVVFTDTPVYLATFETASTFPFSAEEAYLKGSVVKDILEVVPEVSEETGFYYQVSKHGFIDRVFQELPEFEFYLSADCSDFFSSATADSQRVTADNVSVYVQAYRDVLLSGVTDMMMVATVSGRLFASRVRGVNSPLAGRYPAEISVLFK